MPLVALSMLLLGWLAASTTAPTPESLKAPGLFPFQEPQTLEAGKPMKRRISGGETHSYQVFSDGGQYLRVSMGYNGPGFRLRLFAPNGSDVRETAGADAQGELSLSVVTEARGAYRLEVRSPREETPAEDYQIVIDELRRAEAQDSMRVLAESAFSEADRLYSAGTKESVTKSIAQYEEAAELSRVIGDTRLESQALNNEGYSHSSLGDTTKSLDYFNRALALKRKIGDRKGEGSTLDNIAQAYYSLGERRKALDYMSEVLSIRRQTGDQAGEARTLSNLGVIYDSLGEKQKALETYTSTLPVARTLGDKGAEAILLTQMASLYRSLGDNQHAIEYYGLALTLQEALNDIRGQAVIRGGLGLLHDSIGDGQKALDNHTSALALFRKSGDRRGEGSALNNIGLALYNLGDNEAALDQYAQSLALRRATADRGGEAVTLHNIALAHDTMGNHQSALDHYAQALLLRRQVGDRSGEAYTLSGIGRALAASGEPLKALDHLNQALALRRSVGDRRGEANTLYNVGLVHYSLGEMREALEAFNAALPIWRSVGDPNGEATTIYGIARVALKRGDLAQARARIEESLRLAESVRKKVTVQELRSSSFALAQQFYELDIDVLTLLHEKEPAKKYDEAAFEMSERARARTLLESLAESAADIRKAGDPALLQRERELRHRLNARAAGLTSLLGVRHTDEQEAAARAEIEETRMSFQAVEARIRQDNPRYAALTQAQPLTAWAIRRQAIDADSVLLEFSLGDDRSHLWAVTPTTLKSYRLPKRVEIEAAARRMCNLVTARNQRIKFETVEEKKARIVQADSEYPEAAAALSRMILGPVASQLGNKTLLIVADGALHYVPFAALPAPIGPAGRAVPLGVTNRVVSLPSASTLAVLRAELKGRSPAPKTVAVIADPVFDRSDERLKSAGEKVHTSGRTARSLSSAGERALLRDARDIDESSEFHLQRLPFTRREADQITALAPANGRKEAVDFAASLSTATNPEISEYRYVHFATHGFVSSRQPELSGVVLSLVDERGVEQDGFLRANEILNLKLPAELIVLSGCRTGLGKEIRGEGLISLTRSFMYAGSARVMVSLWDIHDEATAEFMSRFYTGMLKRRLPPAEALRVAQASMWRDKRWQSPYYWAAFVLQGEPR